MQILTRPVLADPAPRGPDPAARAAWRRRVARIGSLIQLAFAALWFARGALATGWPGQLLVAVALAAGAIAVAAWGATATKGLARRPPGLAARKLERAVCATVAIV